MRTTSKSLSCKALSNLFPILDKQLRVHRLDRTRARQVHSNDLSNPAGISGHHHDLIGEENRFVDAVGDKDCRFLVLLPYREKFGSHLIPRLGIKGSERFIQ